MGNQGLCECNRGLVSCVFHLAILAVLSWGRIKADVQQLHQVSPSLRDPALRAPSGLQIQVRGHSRVRKGRVKVGTKVKNIRLVEGDHDIDCKIDGIGAMKLKSEFVKKV